MSWCHVIVSLERHGYTHGAIGAAIGSSRSTVEGWKNKHASTRHEDGESLIELWCNVMQKGREELPLRVGHTLSAAQLR